jgi:glycerol-3-phosphate dehydrogenase (NAD+)
VHTIPVQHTADYLKRIKDKIPPTLPIISASKGIHSESLQYMNEIVPTALDNAAQPFAAISGPSFAKELVENQPTAVVVASESEQLRNDAQQLFHHRYLRVYTSDDVIGVEVGGALKVCYYWLVSLRVEKRQINNDNDTFVTMTTHTRTTNVCM